MLIKFKVYDEFKKEYIKDPVIRGETGKLLHDYVLPKNSYTVLQFTGFNDIYEGDVVYDEANKAYALIRWDENDGVWMVEYDDDCLPLGDCYYNEFNVVAHYPTTPEQAYQDYLKTLCEEN